MVYVVWIAPTESAVRVCLRTPDQAMLTDEAGTQPGPESMVTTVPWGPETGLIVADAVKVIFGDRLTPDDAPVATMACVPQVETSVEEAVRAPLDPAVKL